MGRKKHWSSKRYEAWCALRKEPGFAVLELLGSMGIEKIDRTDLQGLIKVSPALSDSASLSEIKDAICGAARRLTNDRRTDAMLVVLRATEESANLPTESVHRLARVKLGEADPHIPTQERRLGRAPTELELIETLSKDNSNFRRGPNLKRKPGDYFLLLRELYSELVPGAESLFEDSRTGPNSLSSDIAKSPPPVNPSASKKAAQRSPTTSNIEAVRKALKRHFRTELELTQLARILLTDQDVIENLVMDIKLSDDRDDWFRFKVIREFHARFTEYTVGVVLGDDARATVTRCVPELKDVIWLPTETPNLDAVVDEMIQDGLLEIRDRLSQTGFKAARFLPLQDDHNFVTRIEHDGAITKDAYRLLGIDIAGGDSEVVHYRSTLNMPLRRTRRRCAWFADGPTFVDRISIDLQEFTDAVDSEHANVYFLLPGASSYSKDVELKTKRFERVVHDWVVRHHGFIIHW